MYGYVELMSSLLWLLAAFLGIGAIYLVVRVVSVAYFRTKLEHLRSVLRELNGGRHNGEG